MKAALTLSARQNATAGKISSARAFRAGVFSARFFATAASLLLSLYIFLGLSVDTELLLFVFEVFREFSVGTATSLQSEAE